ncbi:MAG: LysR family transcriptional regulator [Gammaproteobacteria bacterium]|nr:LysR family transcriptional regulator [Gammaproteobacteria bacterium]
MDWRSVKFDWNHARAFLVTAEEGSLSAAARALGMTQPTLGRQVTTLEEELGVALFERVGKGLELTPSGIELLEYVRTMGEAAGNLSLAASGQSNSIEGNVCISATDLVTILAMPTIVEKLRLLHPGITIELVASNSESDLKRREADIAIRGFRPTQADLIARKIGDVTAHLYASPNYLRQLGNPTSPQELTNANFICDNSEQIISLLNGHGLNISSKNFPITTASHITQWELVKKGAGLALFPDQLADKEPHFQRVLPDIQPYTGPLWLVAHRELRTNRRVRIVFDFLVEELQEWFD